MADTDKILARVRKMLALAADEAASEGERENAMRMAHKLLVKYNLDPPVEAEEEFRGEFGVAGWSMVWTCQIRNSIARLFMCQYLLSRRINGTRRLHLFIGKESNATTAILLSTHIIESVLKEARRMYKTNLCPETRSFGIGAAMAISQRVREMMAASAQEKSESSGRELVLADLAVSEALANAEFCRQKYPQMKSSRGSRMPTDSEALRAGYAHGQRKSLRAEVYGQARERLV